MDGPIFYRNYSLNPVLYSDIINKTTIKLPSVSYRVSEIDEKNGISCLKQFRILKFPTILRKDSLVALCSFHYIHTEETYSSHLNLKKKNAPIEKFSEN